jgi:AbrB family looped-hinge helix DNA binding protein
MPSKLTLDRSGRIALPKPLLDRMRLSPGDALEFKAWDEQIVLRPLRAAGTMRKKRGVWVYRTGRSLSSEAVNRTLERVRRERDKESLGQDH